MAVDYQSNVGYINSPYVVMHDPDDMVTNFKGTTILMEESSTPEHEKFLVEMPGGMHNINVHMVNEVTEHAVDFIDKMLK
jgi:antitoxin component HigA of HigAB toxin-antitoxin module